ncbi:MAG: 30S ribosomal protein S4 [Microgenomates group bacterium GW2011_GWA1_48_10]|uniref:Small ribosomal subunit protein uS4 n=1 Tax=Candidatus Gottesmanbacteria bacterium RIFCSPHIGHO2_01_FULL_47_48 TaxID=1798381 RepID=A0A1F6A2I7_9BACT|nr:MAG: 30S ribosomal protein S4 [Microgenomates group bacterium GW2011_GWA1_48_10]OGG18886.1 MAG: 30S ribosomal protein S4 [Candidatus Gottesmanbacteria bacterium RIFCSPHIGHO2_01_FULL_47_48]
MARYTGPKHRLARREGANILEKTSPSLARRLGVPPGVHGPKGRPGKQSDYGKQLREKQKAKRIYGISENQFRNYFDTATKVKGKTGEALLQLLESRLDNIVYRLGFSSSRAMARQLVSHGHIQVDGRKVSIPSYLLKVNQVITLSPTAIKTPVVQKLLEAAETKVPNYLDRKAAAGKFVKTPPRDDIKTEINEQLIIEYYSR